MQSGRDFLGAANHLKKQGLSELQVAKGLGLRNTSELRAKISIAKAEKRQADASQALRLKDKGMSNTAIGRQMGIPESSVRALLNPALSERRDILQNTADFLKGEVDKGGYLDIGSGTENWKGISANKLNTAVAILREQGYTVHKIQTPQLFGKGKTTIKVLAQPGVTGAEVNRNRDQIRTVAAFSENKGRSFTPVRPPVSVSSSRIAVRHAEQGGANADGVIYLRPGVPDLSLGSSRYAQVRIAVDKTHYLKGMAMYKDDLPAGVDILFNTSKHDTGNKMDAMKPAADEKTPWTTFIRINRQRTYKDASGKTHLSPINIVNEQGDWHTWRPSLSSQVLSKQSRSLAKQQLDEAYKQAKSDLDEIRSLTNPVIKKKLLMSFGDETDSASVHLAAAALPRQNTHVILPFEHMNPKEIYAPNYRPGETVALIRHPHGGTFEIPELRVNNRNPEARKALGSHAPDAVGIHPSVAKRLSGADFDGDAVIVVPNNRRMLRTTSPLDELTDFDPHIQYKKYDGMPVMTKEMKQQHMGDVSNLITDMTIRGAKPDEIARAVKHSMVVIDAVNHELDYKRSYEENGIRALKIKYQGGLTEKGRTRGASTIVSRASSQERVPQRSPRPYRRGGPIDVKTGEKVYEKTGATYVRNGKTIIKTERSTKLAEAKDARSLSSGTPMEEIYAAHSNSLKALANRARLEALKTGGIQYSPSANRTYAHEVATLKAALNLAKKNAPLERQAQLIANSIVAMKTRDNPHMDPDDLRKEKAKALQSARNRIGAGKDQIHISLKEWEAIQSGAISTHLLNEIINNSDLDRLRELATPRLRTVMTKTKMSRARAMLSLGYTQADVASALGVSVSTLNSALLSEGG